MKNLFGLLPEQASVLASKIDTLYLTLIGISVFFTILIAGLLILFSVKYRRKSEDEIPTQIHGNLALELTWTIIPLIIVLVLFVWGAVLFVQGFRPVDGAKEIFVVGKQWMWKIQHPEGVREINALHVPVDTPVKLVMTSEDVIHSFFVPAFRMKMDVVPGKYSYAYFEATEPGTYHLFCTEYCGTKHSEMIGTVTVLSQEDYATWLSERSVEYISTSGLTGIAAKGEKLFNESGCAACHHSNGGSIGPDLVGIYNHKVQLNNGKSVLADETYLRESLIEPNEKVVAGYGPLMPTYKNQLGEEEIVAIIEYIKALEKA